jgi:hypothetical protein
VSPLENRCRTERALDLSFDVGRVARFRRTDVISAEKLYHIHEANKENPRRLKFGGQGLMGTFRIFAAKRLYGTAQGFSPGLCAVPDPPCLSAVVMGRWDEGGKVAAEARL